MTDEAIGPLRRRMIEDTTIRKFAPKTHPSAGPFYIGVLENRVIANAALPKPPPAVSGSRARSGG